VALMSYRARLAIVEHLAKVDPSNTGWQQQRTLGEGRPQQR
jgi:hypothetical protein